MHELGLMQSIVDTIQDYVRDNNVEKVVKIILEIGNMSGVVPEALEFCFDLCAKGTTLDGAQLEIERVSALGRCRKCGREFDLVANEFCCPEGHEGGWELVSGRELIIKGLEVI
jgi:hydrogenase nickel incorporation protein HypA/HybF